VIVSGARGLPSGLSDHHVRLVGYGRLHPEPGLLLRRVRSTRRVLSVPASGRDPPLLSDCFRPLTLTGRIWQFNSSREASLARRYGTLHTPGNGRKAFFKTQSASERAVQQKLGSDSPGAAALLSCGAAGCCCHAVALQAGHASGSDTRIRRGPCPNSHPDLARPAAKPSASSGERPGPLHHQGPEPAAKKLREAQPASCGCRGSFQPPSR